MLCWGLFLLSMNFTSYRYCFASLSRTKIPTVYPSIPVTNVWIALTPALADLFNPSIFVSVFAYVLFLISSANCGMYLILCITRGFRVLAAPLGSRLRRFLFARPSARPTRSGRFLSNSRLHDQSPPRSFQYIKHKKICKISSRPIANTAKICYNIGCSFVPPFKGVLIKRTSNRTL